MCGGESKALERLQFWELMTEPIFPFIKSKEEIEYEKRLKKRQEEILNIKRAHIDLLRVPFKNDSSNSVLSTKRKAGEILEM